MTVYVPNIIISLSDGKTEFALNPVPPSHVVSLSHKRVIENQANTLELTLVDTSAYRVENCLINMEDASNRFIYYQYGFSYNLSKIFKGLIYDYTPTISGSTVSLRIKAVSQEALGKKAVSDSHGSSSSSSSSSGSRNESSVTKVLNSAFTLKSNSVMAGHTSEFLKLANKYNIDPLLAAAIGVQETGWWTSNAVRNYYNFGGMMVGGKLLKFNSVASGLDAYFKMLRTEFYDKGMSTPETMGPVYCVPPTGWISAVRTQLNYFEKQYNNYEGKSSNRSNLLLRSTPGIGSPMSPTLLPKEPRVVNKKLETCTISEVVSNIAERNGWSKGLIEETTTINKKLLQYNITDIDFINTILKPLAQSRSSGRYGYVFYLSNLGSKVFCNFHIPDTKSATKSYGLLLSGSGSIKSSWEDKNTNKPETSSFMNGMFTFTPRSSLPLASTMLSAGAPLSTEPPGIGRIPLMDKKPTVSKEPEISGFSTSVDRGDLSGKLNYGTNKSVVLSWSPSLVGALLMSKYPGQNTEATMLDATGDTYMNQAVDDSTTQYDENRKYLGDSISSGMKSSLSQLDNTLGYKYTKIMGYMSLSTASIVGDHSIQFGNTLDFNVYVGQTKHHSSGKYLVIEVEDKIDNSGFVTNLSLSRNSKLDEVYAEDSSSTGDKKEKKSSSSFDTDK